MAALLARRTTTELTVLHDRDPLFVTLSSGSIRNGYTVKILNKAREPKYVVGARGCRRGCGASAKTAATAGARRAGHANGASRRRVFVTARGGPEAETLAGRPSGPRTRGTARPGQSFFRGPRP